ncbi:glutamate-5-semialdehyde dehydrogenase [Clostridiisalibacter paucivorans]|uniref:glutamate-5-semialdehyde dehydrogenase n=1 Tax=Clostridiisalibacter paucivorans TaxID=408753 RepID=UPI00047E2183|nr:glutamate-5-semialdehyde dehydrogenase [Clostridiisalibacter paucivorans]
MDIKNYVLEKAKKAKKASRILATMDTNTKNKALLKMSDALIRKMDFILEANSKDIEAGRHKGLSKSLIDRLLLTEDRIKDISDGLRKIADLKDPIGEVISMWKRPNNLKIGQVKVPLGVIGMIYEARPNVTVDAAALCLKSGNVVILRGGSEAINSNIALSNIIIDAAISSGLPEGCIQLLEIPDREAVNEMMKLNKYIDILIPRGGAGLIQNVVNNSTVPVIQTGVGNCHIYIDNYADLDMAEKIVINAKTQRPAVCNTMETLLVHKDVAKDFLPKIYHSLTNLDVEIRGCEKTKIIIPDVIDANEKDWNTEYLDLILAVKVVDSIDQAIDHIYQYGTGHSEAIITDNYTNSQKFLLEIDAAAVYVNASTRFTDGSRYGFGAEIGISTQKLHTRGPMGLDQLTTIKYIGYGEGQTT